MSLYKIRPHSKYRVLVLYFPEFFFDFYVNCYVLAGPTVVFLIISDHFGISTDHIAIKL